MPLVHSLFFTSFTLPSPKKSKDHWAFCIKVKDEGKINPYEKILVCKTVNRNTTKKKFLEIKESAFTVH